MSDEVKDLETGAMENENTAEGTIEVEDGSEEEVREETSRTDSKESKSEAEEVKEEEAEAEAKEAPEDEEEASEASGKDGFFSRKHKKELEKKDREIADIKDRYQRTMAEYQNFRNRTEKEKADLYAYAVRDVMTKILPVLDNLQRGIAAIPKEQRDEAFAQGMDKIEKQFEKALNDIGVKPIEAKGSVFDPNFHNAVMHIDDDNVGENVVVEEFQKGYTYKDSVVRHSMVKVAN